MPCRCFFSCEEEAAIQRQYLVALENLGAPDMVWSLWMLYANLNMPYNPFSLQGSTFIFISLFLKPVLLCWRDQCPPSPASWMIATMLEWNYSFVVTQEQINRKHLSFQHSLTVDESCVVFPKFAFKPENYVSLQNTKYLKQYTSIYTSCQLQHFVRGALEQIHVHNSKRWCNLFSFLKFSTLFFTHGFTSKHRLKVFFFLVGGCFHPVCFITGNNGNEVHAVFKKKSPD